VVALADVILGTFSNEPGIEERLEIPDLQISRIRLSDRTSRLRV
jgi:hypothetical protein